jgi:hypothetical protein
MQVKIILTAILVVCLVALYFQTNQVFAKWRTAFAGSMTLVGAVCGLHHMLFRMTA